MRDVVIAGGGVAGASLGLHLGRLGMKVTVLESTRGPRDKVCGEGLMPAGAAEAALCGLDLPGRPFLGVRYHRGPETAAARFPHQPGLGIRRLDFDSCLLAAAAKVCEVRESSPVDSPVVEDGRIVGVASRGEVLRARLTVAADGVHSPLRRRLRIPVQRGAPRFALRGHFAFRSEPWVQVFWGEDHEFYVTPLSGGLTNVTLLAPLRQGRASRQQIWSRLLRAQPQLSGMLQNVQPAGPLRGAAAWNIRPSLRHLPGFLLHGDAAGYVDPITGGGMTQALLASRLFARGLRRAIPDDLQTLDQARQELLREYRLLTRAALWLAGRPLAAAASFRILKSWPGLFSMLLGMAGSAR